MKKVKINLLKTVHQNIQQYMQATDEFVYRFEVVPLDYNVENFETPLLTLTKELLVFSYDETMELYALNEVTISYEGIPPKFTLWQQVFEGKNLYSPAQPDHLQKMRDFDDLPRLSITPVGKVPLSFVPRTNQVVSKSYKTWAVFQLINNLQNHTEVDPILQEMVNGNFTTFNQKGILTFIVSFLLFLGLRTVASWLLPDIASTLLEFAFIAVTIGMGIWVIMTIEKNNKRFHQVFMRYSNNQPSHAEMNAITNKTPKLITNKNKQDNPNNIVT